MSALLDLYPEGTHPVLSGVAPLHGLLDRMHAGATQALVSGEHARVVAELDRATRRLESLKLGCVAVSQRFFPKGNLTAAAFGGRSRVDIHRMINATLAAELAGPIHALALKAQTKDEAG